MFVAFLLVIAVALTWPVPRLLPLWHGLRLTPGAGLLLWQSVSLAGVYSALAAAPVACIHAMQQGNFARHIGLMEVAGLVSGFATARLLLQAHLVGRRLRKERRAHTHLLDVLSEHAEHESIGVDTRQLRVLDHETPTAYCVPGRHRRLVVSDSTIDSLADDELSAVIAHEQAHLRQRHDLILEFFTVLHTTVPVRVRSSKGMSEVRLLIERLADQAAVRAVGPIPLARALVVLARGAHPAAALGAGTSSDAPVRVRLLAEDAHRPLTSLAAVTCSAAAVAAPLVCTVAALRGLG